jgi:hypothetical protein
VISVSLLRELNVPYLLIHRVYINLMLSEVGLECLLCLLRRSVCSNGIALHIEDVKQFT